MEKVLKRDGNGDFVKLKKSSCDGKTDAMKHARDDSSVGDFGGPDDVDALRITRRGGVQDCGPSSH
jgi:hypothetical protein